jgi:hypothetical protein
MCDTLVWSFDAIRSLNWLEVIKTLAPVATAIIAFIALRNWQRQDKAKRESEFLDSLIEATHAYIAEMSKPIMFLEMAKIGMTSHVPAGDSCDDADNAVKGAIVYIQKNGEQDAKRLRDQLEAVQSLTIKLRSLAAKGQVFKFANYAECHTALALLTWHFDRMGAFAAVLGSPSLNWQNPKVLKHLKDVLAIDPDEIRKNVQDGNVTIIEFARDTYSRIYG